MLDRYGPLAQAVEDLIPPHLMSLAMDRLYAEGFEVRLDTRGYLNRSIINILKRHTGQEMVVATKADNAAKDVLRFVSFDDAATAMIAVSLLLCKLVDEKLYLDTQSQAILSALMVIADTREDDNPDTAHLLSTAERKAGQMLDEVLKMGFYNHAAVNDG